MILKGLSSILLAAISLPAFSSPMTAVLSLKSKVPMAKLADEVTNPSSPRYGKFYTPEEIRAFAAPSQGEYEQFLAQLQAEGLKVTGESVTHLWVSVSGDSSTFENVFSTKLTTIASKHALARTAVIPNRLGFIDSVIGLDNTRHAVPKMKIQASARDKDSGIPQATIKTAYQLDPIYAQGLSGKGQHIAVATYDDFVLSDVTTFYQQSNINPSVDKVVFNGTPQQNSNSQMETALDAEFSGMIAPGASIHVFSSATNDDTGEAQMFTAILDDNRAKVVNYSWGDCETNLNSAHATAMQTIFERAVAQGVNIMIASGDSGSDSCQNNSTVADWPAANDHVVAVGGTTFGQNGTSIAETGWNGSGGGVSGLWALPSWQSGVIPSTFTKRSYPDVAFNADPSTGQAVYVTNGGSQMWIIIGGTSMAAPQWSGFMALVGEARAAAGLNPVGYLPLRLYAATTAQQTSIFNDVTSGSNGAYSCATGWDAVTGFGSMQGSNLLKYLSAN